jgi:hypothetical protein
VSIGLLVAERVIKYVYCILIVGIVDSLSWYVKIVSEIKSCCCVTSVVSLSLLLFSIVKIGLQQFS